MGASLHGARWAAVATLLAALGLSASGCASSGERTASPAELALERSQFIQVATGLRAATGAVDREVGAARAAWPSLANGLGSTIPTSTLQAVTAAGLQARALPSPPFVAGSGRLTGPAAGLAGLYETYARLCERAWHLTQASISTIASGPSSMASFARANVVVYLDAIYDSHYDLSLIGKKIAEGYARLGGPAAFRAKLPRAVIDALASAYSIAAVRLEPHPGPGAELS